MREGKGIITLTAIGSLTPPLAYALTALVHPGFFSLLLLSALPAGVLGAVGVDFESVFGFLPRGPRVGLVDALGYVSLRAALGAGFGNAVICLVPYLLWRLARSDGESSPGDDSAGASPATQEDDPAPPPPQPRRP